MSLTRDGDNAFVCPERSSNRIRHPEVPQRHDATFGKLIQRGGQTEISTRHDLPHVCVREAKRTPTRSTSFARLPLPCEFIKSSAKLQTFGCGTTDVFPRWERPEPLKVILEVTCQVQRRVACPEDSRWLCHCHIHVGNLRDRQPLQAVVSQAALDDQALWSLTLNDLRRKLRRRAQMVICANKYQPRPRRMLELSEIFVGVLDIWKKVVVEPILHFVSSGGKPHLRCHVMGFDYVVGRAVLLD
mmetsp:Transcript_4048/g.10728  ORF Transcript_4048/g.10728 Transcript_4048/m.10728 type:complete len:244 (+) Transcript_4048:536-1267(+)